MSNLLRNGFLIFIIFLLTNLRVANAEPLNSSTGDFLSTIVSENNGLLEIMVIVLIVLVFGYAAKLFYERRFRKE